VTLPIWKLTRTSVGRQVFDALANAGVVVTRLAQFEHTLDRPLPDPPAPGGVSLRVGPPNAFTLTGRMARSELSGRDRIVAAVADDRVVGVQPVSVSRSFHVKPLERTVDFDGAYFWGLYVAPEWRRQGVATALVARALSFVAEATPERRVQTLVGIDNAPSKRVLRSTGFERERTRSYYRAFGLRHRGRA
jgi:GNAT superfamily N-acetyltransferase